MATPTWIVSCEGNNLAVRGKAKFFCVIGSNGPLCVQHEHVDGEKEGEGGKKQEEEKEEDLAYQYGISRNWSTQLVLQVEVGSTCLQRREFVYRQPLHVV